MTKRTLIKKYQKKLEAQATKKFSAYLKKLFPMICGFKSIKVYATGNDDYDFYTFKIHQKVVIVGIDKYNNVWLNKCKDKLTILELQAIHEFLVEYLEHNDSYHNRTGTSFLIDYWEMFKPNKKFVKEMIRINVPVEHDEGLKTWLTEYQGWRD